MIYLHPRRTRQIDGQTGGREVRRRTAGIARLRNCLRINKLYDILQTVERLAITNFSFRGIGVFHRDEERVRQAGAQALLRLWREDVFRAQ